MKFLLPLLLLIASTCFAESDWVTKSLTSSVSIDYPQTPDNISTGEQFAFQTRGTYSTYLATYQDAKVTMLLQESPLSLETYYSQYIGALVNSSNGKLMGVESFKLNGYTGVLFKFVCKDRNGDKRIFLGKSILLGKILYTASYTAYEIYWDIEKENRTQFLESLSVSYTNKALIDSEKKQKDIEESGGTGWLLTKLLIFFLSVAIIATVAVYLSNKKPNVLEKDF
jgi:hypothetical protein